MLRIMRSAGLAATALLWATTSLSKTREANAAAFGAREGVANMSVSPDGSQAGASAQSFAPKLLQQSFDEASRAFESGDWRRSIDLFRSLRGRLKLGTAPRTVADIREGYALLRIGEVKSAIPLLEAGAAAAASHSKLASDRLLAIEGLAEGYEEVQ